MNDLTKKKKRKKETKAVLIMTKVALSKAKTQGRKSNSLNHRGLQLVTLKGTRVKPSIRQQLVHH